MSIDVKTLALAKGYTSSKFSGFEPNKYLGTDESGNVIVKDGNSTLETDATLSFSGVPADAKAVGDEIDNIKEAINTKSLTVELNTDGILNFVYK